MQDALLHGLDAQRRKIHARWETLLRTERVNTPLAYPDSLVHLIEWTLDEVFAALRAVPLRRRGERAYAHASARPECPCGRNPLLAFFLAGEQALLEALVLEQAARIAIDPVERDTALAELYHAIRSIARREVGAFCAVCQHREDPRPAEAEAAPAASATEAAPGA